MRFLLVLFFLVTLPMAARAVDAPAGQLGIAAGQTLRGRFVEERQIPGLNGPMRSSGAFVVAPGHGLLWNIEKPFPTSTIITPGGLVQDIGGMALKVPAKNLRHIYEMVGAALAGDWNALGSDFVVTPSGTALHWQMLLTPKKDSAKLPYSTIIVSGGHFVENIAMMKGDSTAETLSFTDAALSQAPPTALELAAFNEGAR